VETYAYVLDYLPHGRSTEQGFRREPQAIAIGETELKLLELVPKSGAALTVGSRIALVPVGGAAPPIEFVRRRLSFGDLTSQARNELSVALEGIVRGDPKKYLRIFNEAEAVSRRFHLLELLPGIGKKTMQAIVDERKRAPFASFADLEERLRLPKPEKLIVGRIEKELSGADDKYRLFVAQ
jgi:putative nucleotide binding protein